MAPKGTKEEGVSPGGSTLYRHEEASAWAPPQGEVSIEAITDHVERHLGLSATVFHEIVSDTVHVDVLLVQPSGTQPHVRLVTSGMSDLPMQVPEGADRPRHAELMMTLPAGWKLDQADFEDERWYWPIRLLKTLARLPHKHDTWLGTGHTVPNGDPAAPYAPGTSLCGAIVLPSVTVPEAFGTLEVSPEKTIHFFAAVPLYLEEMDLKLRDGTGALLAKLGAAGLGDLVDTRRRNVAKKRFFLF